MAHCADDSYVRVLSIFTVNYGHDELAYKFLTELHNAIFHTYLSILNGHHFKI